MTSAYTGIEDTYGAMQIAEKKTIIDIHFDTIMGLSNENQIYKYSNQVSGSINYDANAN